MCIVCVGRVNWGTLLADGRGAPCSLYCTAIRLMSVHGDLLDHVTSAWLPAQKREAGLPIWSLLSPNTDTQLSPRERECVCVCVCVCGCASECFVLINKCRHTRMGLHICEVKGWEAMSEAMDFMNATPDKNVSFHYFTFHYWFYISIQILHFNTDFTFHYWFYISILILHFNTDLTFHYWLYPV